MQSRTLQPFCLDCNGHGALWQEVDGRGQGFKVPFKDTPQ